MISLGKELTLDGDECSLHDGGKDSLRLSFVKGLKENCFSLRRLEFVEA
jgi:hypothetical protein